MFSTNYIVTESRVKDSTHLVKVKVAESRISMRDSATFLSSMNYLGLV